MLHRTPLTTLALSAVAAAPAAAAPFRRQRHQHRHRGRQGRHRPGGQFRPHRRHGPRRDHQLRPDPRRTGALLDARDSGTGTRWAHNGPAGFVADQPATVTLSRAANAADGQMRMVISVFGRMVDETAPAS